MEKLLVNLFIPTIQKSFDLFIPQDVEIRTLLETLRGGIAYMCPGRYVATGNESLLSRDFSKPLDPSKCLCDYGIRNGARLLYL